jgi:hypothetical protein
VATRMLFENDRVRIWEMDLPPGGESAVHRHDLDYILVQLEGDRIAGVPERDSAGPYDEYVEAAVVSGNAIYIERGGVETAVNTGKQRYREILIELKD